MSSCTKTNDRDECIGGCLRNIRRIKMIINLWRLGRFRKKFIRFLKKTIRTRKYDLEEYEDLKAEHKRLGATFNK